MKKSINIGVFPASEPYEKAFPALKAAGFDAVELNMLADRQASASLWRGADAAELAAVRKLASDNGLEITGVVTDELWRNKLSSSDAAERGRAVDAVRALISSAAALGSDSVLVVPGVAEADMDYLRAMDNVRCSFEILCPEAASAGVVLALENVWNKFFISPVEIRDFVDSFPGGSVGAYLDLGNMCKWSYPQHWIQVLGKRIHRIHVKGYNTDTNTFCMLLEGNIDWGAAMNALDAADYDGYMTAELWGNDDPYETIKSISADMSAILALSESGK